MIAILSPAKNINIGKFENFEFEEPIFLNQALKINNNLKSLQPKDIETIMKVNSDIAFKTFRNLQDFNINIKNSHALKSYDGLVFKNINTKDFTNEDIYFANKTIRILSGLYGVLKPLDFIQNYRLEMGLKINIEDCKNLYDFWKDKIYNEIFKERKTVINLASKEYTKTICPFLKQNDKFINIDFLIFKNGKYKTVATSAKMARGKMARYIIKNRIEDKDLLKKFYFEDYSYNEYLSNDNNFIFSN